MKTLLLTAVFVSSLVFHAAGQAGTEGQSQTQAAPVEAAVETQPVLEASPVTPEVETTAVQTRHGQVDGVLLQMVRSEDLFQLINPFAPVRFGTGEANRTPPADDGVARGVTSSPATAEAEGKSTRKRPGIALLRLRF